MRILATVAFLLLSYLAQAQQVFTGFSECKNVQWAALWQDTIRFSNPNLSLLLRQKLSKGQIKAGTLSWEDAFVIKKHIPLDTIVHTIEPNREHQVVNEQGEVIATVRAVDDVLLSSIYFDDELKDLVECAQIIYVKRGRLYSYIPWISPKRAVVTSWQQKLGMANAFTTAFNTRRKFSAKQQRQSIRLGSSTATLLPDSMASLKMIKQLYEQELLQVLWPQIAKGKYEIFAIDSGKTISFAQVTQWLMAAPIANVPVYDDEGNLIRTVMPASVPLLPASFTKVILEQDWYYHARLNRAFTKPTALLLYASKPLAYAPNEQDAPILKIRLQ